VVDITEEIRVIKFGSSMSGTFEEKLGHGERVCACVCVCVKLVSDEGRL